MRVRARMSCVYRFSKDGPLLLEESPWPRVPLRPRQGLRGSEDAEPGVSLEAATAASCAELRPVRCGRVTPGRLRVPAPARAAGVHSEGARCRTRHLSQGPTRWWGSRPRDGRASKPMSPREGTFEEKASRPSKPNPSCSPKGRNPTCAERRRHATSFHRKCKKNYAFGKWRFRA